MVPFFDFSSNMLLFPIIAAAFGFVGVALFLSLRIQKKNLEMQKESSTQIQNMQLNTALQAEKMQKTNFEQIKEIQKTTIENMAATTILAAGTMGDKLADKINPVLVTNQVETEKNSESIKSLSSNIFKLESTTQLGIKELGEKDQNNFNLAKADMDRNFNTVNLNVERVNLNVKTVDTSLSHLAGNVKNLEGRFSVIEVILAGSSNKKIQSPQELKLNADLKFSKELP